MKKTVLCLAFFCAFLYIACESEDENTNTTPQPFSSDPCELVFPTPDSLQYEAVYDRPTIIAPISDTFYSNEVVEIRWTLPDGLWNTELQIIESNTPFECEAYDAFHELDNGAQAGYGNQLVHFYSTSEFFEPVQNTIYVSYRARTTDIESPQGYSKWTDVKNFTILPLSSLNKVTITVPYTLQFTTEEVNNEFYSGITTLPNYRLSEIAEAYDLEYDKIRLSRIVGLEGEFNTKTGTGANPFSKLILGFNEVVDPNESAYPFAVFGELFPGTFEENPVPGILYSNLTQNLVPEMNQYDLKMAYVLEDIVGSEHEVVVNLTLEIFSEN